MINSTSDTHSRVRMTSSSGSLVIVNVKPSDSGKYTCTSSNVTSLSSSTNDVSRATAIRLIVYSASARLMIVATGSDYVSVTWIGIEPTVNVGSARYAIVYRPLSGWWTYHRRTLREQQINDEEWRRLRWWRHRRRCWLLWRWWRWQWWSGTGSWSIASDCLFQELNQVIKLGARASQLRPHRGECLRGVNSTDSRSSSRPPPSYRKVVDVRPYMRGYWIGGLTPRTRYEFCIGIIRRVEHDIAPTVDSSPSSSSSLSAVQLINCSVAVTTSKNSKNRHRFGEQMFVDDLEESDMVVVAATGAVFAIVCLIPGSIGLLGALVRRRRRRMDYVEPFSAGWPQSARDQLPKRHERRSRVLRHCWWPRYDHCNVQHRDIDVVNTTRWALSRHIGTADHIHYIAHQLSCHVTYFVHEFLYYTQQRRHLAALCVLLC